MGEKERSDLPRSRRHALLGVPVTRSTRLPRHLAVLGRRRTSGKLAEAIGLDYPAHRRARAAAWLR